ncbi:MAG TPA: LON peptidase substrate-binding domain-containing protein [Pyrinomonadaceae bacterium]|nr:LON peptidase substrate-binding domain-containing protein [Pyrinomonadaceae bacterium]
MPEIDQAPPQVQNKKTEGVPFVIPVVPLQNTTLFPETMVPLSVGRPGSMAAVEAALASEEKLLAGITIKPDRATENEAKPDDLFEIGTLLMIKRMERVEDTLHLIVQGTDRIQVVGWEQEEPCLRARVKILPELETHDSEVVEATKRNVQTLIQQALAYLPQVPPEVRLVVLGADDPVRLAYFLGSILSLGVEKEQQMLEAHSVDKLIGLSHDFLVRELKIIEVRSKIATQAQAEKEKEERDYILRLQLKAIQQELGDGIEDRTAVDTRPNAPPREIKSASGLAKIFVGHGRNPVWNRVVVFLKDELGLQVEAFETSSHASQHIVDVLKSFLSICDAAVIVMTADDATTDGNVRARQNVVHEIGLFQGRFGFDRVILVQQANTEDFSNLAGLQTIRFDKRVEEGFYDLRRAIEELQRTAPAREPQLLTSIQPASSTPS